MSTLPPFRTMSWTLLERLREGGMDEATAGEQARAAIASLAELLAGLLFSDTAFDYTTIEAPSEYRLRVAARSARITRPADTGTHTIDGYRIITSFDGTMACYEIDAYELTEVVDDIIGYARVNAATRA